MRWKTISDKGFKFVILVFEAEKEKLVVKKRLLSVVLAACLIISYSFSLSGCGLIKAAQSAKEAGANSGKTDAGGYNSVTEGAQTEGTQTGGTQTGGIQNKVTQTGETNTDGMQTSGTQNTETQADKAQALMQSMVGAWVFSDTTYDVYIEIELRVDEDNTFEMQYNDRFYMDNLGEVHYYKGHMESTYIADEPVIDFVVDETDDDIYSQNRSLGSFFVDRIMDGEYGQKLMYLTQVNNGDSIVSIYADEMRPIFCEIDEFVDYYAEYLEAEALDKNAKQHYVDNPSYNYYCSVDNVANPSIKVSLEGYIMNEIIDTEEWFDYLGREVPLDDMWEDDTYIYCLEDDAIGPDIVLQVYEKDTNRHLYKFDMCEYRYGENYGQTGFEDFTLQEIRYARIVDDVLYIATGHNTYADACPETGYITAIDVNDGSVIWKSKAQVCNSDNFEIVGNCIITGYGFTDEPDYLYVLSMNNGEVVDQLKVKNKIDYIYYSDGRLDVRTYSYNYGFIVDEQ